MDIKLGKELMFHHGGLPPCQPFFFHVAVPDFFFGKKIVTFLAVQDQRNIGTYLFDYTSEN